MLSRIETDVNVIRAVSKAICRRIGRPYAFCLAKEYIRKTTAFCYNVHGGMFQ